MGLDITAYSSLTKVANAKYNEDSEEFVHPDDPKKELRQFYINADFPGREEGIEKDVAYEYKGSMSFRAGSYGGYNQWRSMLANLAGYPAATEDGRTGCDVGAWQATEGPFWELITFSDCEGTIGPVVARKLLADFDAFKDKEEKTWGSDPRCHAHQLWLQWHAAFRLAAQSGAVVFT